MLAKKQLLCNAKAREWETVRILFGLYPIITIGFEDVSFNHYKDVDGIEGQLFSHVEIGWLLDRLRKLAPVREIKGYETARRREQLKLPKLDREFYSNQWYDSNGICHIDVCCTCM